MKKLLRRIGCLLISLSLLIPFAGCNEVKVSDPEENTPLTVYIPSNMENSCTMQVLKDEDFARQVGQNLGRPLEVQVMPSNLDYNEVALLEFSGILLTDDPSWIVPLVENRKLETVEVSEDIVDRSYGQYNNTQYGYVLQDPSCAPQSVVVLANLKALRSLQNTQIQFTPESFYELLVELKEGYRIPLAVSGSPMDAGFTPLLSLFDMAPAGGREMYIQDDTVVYDKLSQQAKDYLTYIQLLYSESLISEDTMELSEYSCAKLIAQNAAAIAVFTEDAYVELALSYAKESGQELVSISIPVPARNAQTNIFAKVVGFLSKNSVEAEAAGEFFSLLQDEVSKFEPQNSNALSSIGKFGLFAPTPLIAQKTDPREACTMYVYWLYQKEYLDMTYLESAYSKIMMGEMQISEFDTAVTGWIEDGRLLNMIEGKYWMENKNSA